MSSNNDGVAEGNIKSKLKSVFNNIQGYLFILPNFIGFVVFLIIPIILGFIISFTNYDGFRQFDFVGIQNYIDMFHDEYFLVSLWNNIVYSVVTVPCTMLLALALALLVNTGIKGTKVFRTMFFLPNISSMVAVGIVWSMIFNPVNGPVNNFLTSIGVENPPGWYTSTDTALLTVMIVAIWKQAGYYMIIFLGGLQTIPSSIYEAADIDGASSIKKFFNITLPLLSPTTFMIFILNIIGSFQVFDLINIMTEGGPGRSTNVLVYRIYQEGFVYSRFGYASAMAYFLFMLVLVVTLIQFRGQKRWESSM